MTLAEMMTMMAVEDSPVLGDGTGVGVGDDDEDDDDEPDDDDDADDPVDGEVSTPPLTQTPNSELMPTSVSPGLQSSASEKSVCESVSWSSARRNVAWLDVSVGDPNELPVKLLVGNEFVSERRPSDAQSVMRTYRLTSLSWSKTLAGIAVKLLCDRSLLDGKEPSVSETLAPRSSTARYFTHRISRPGNVASNVVRLLWLRLLQSTAEHHQ